MKLYLFLVKNIKRRVDTRQIVDKKMFNSEALLVVKLLAVSYLAAFVADFVCAAIGVIELADVV